MASQLVIVTAVPRSLTLNPRALPVSIVVSPRLQGADRLGAFPDWLRWTRRCHDRGVRVTFEYRGHTHTVAAPVAQLRPDLWKALFDEATLVRSHEFSDYSERFVSTYPVRPAIGLL